MFSNSSSLHRIKLNNAAKVFKTKSFFSDNTITAFRNVALDIIPAESLCIIGTSGSGKSVLVRCISGLEEFSSGEFSFLDTDSRNNETTTYKVSDYHSYSNVLSCYLGLQYNEKYNKNHYCHQYFNMSLISNYIYLQKAFLLFGMQQLLTDNTQINSLLESQRILFNIFLELQHSCLNIADTKNNNNHDKKDQYRLIILALDEYLDKLTSTIRTTVINKLFLLLKSSTIDTNTNNSNNNENANDHDTFNTPVDNCINIEGSLIVVTHSKGTLRDVNSRTAIMNNGRLYDIKSNYNKLMFPAQLQLID